MTLHIFNRIVLIALAGVFIVSCGGKQITEEDIMTSEERRKGRQGKVFGDDPLVLSPGRPLFGGGGAKPSEKKSPGVSSGGGGIAVNGYLWRASLDTMSFMPLSSADPFGGVIVTDWYVPPETPGERFKVQVYILDRQLRADGLRVSVFRQVRGEDGTWTEAAVRPETAAQLENAILTRARQLRVDGGTTL